VLIVKAKMSSKSFIERRSEAIVMKAVSSGVYAYWHRLLTWLQLTQKFVIPASTHEWIEGSWEWWDVQR
jgi:hypothetical protein